MFSRSYNIKRGSFLLTGFLHISFVASSRRGIISLFALSIGGNFALFLLLLLKYENSVI